MKRLLLLTMGLSMFSLTTFAQQTIQKSFSGIEKISLNIGSGDLRVDKSSTANVEVEVQYDDEDIRPELRQKGSTLELKEDRLKKNSNSRTSWTLRLPAKMALKTNIGAGEATYDGVMLDLNHNTGAGDIRFTKANCDCQVNVGAGDIELFDSEGAFQANSGTGDFQVDNTTGSFQLNSGTGDLEIEDVAITGSSSFNSGTGDVEVQLSKALSADISINSGTGDSTLDFNGQPMVGEFEMECQKGQGRISAPFSFDDEETDNRRLKKRATIGDAKYQVKVSTGTGTAKVEK